MPRIKIKGYGEVEVDKKTAESIAKMIDQKQPGINWIKAGIWSGRLSDVSGVIYTKEKDHSLADERQKQSLEEFIKERKNILSEPPEVRCERLGMFKLYHKAVTGNEATEEVPEK